MASNKTTVEDVIDPEASLEEGLDLASPVDEAEAGLRRSCAKSDQHRKGD